MSITTWYIPRTDVPGAAPGGGSGYSFIPGGRSLASLGQTPATITGGQDRLIDPAKLDYVRTDNGEWAETQDSRTIMLISLSTRLGESPFDPEHGTSVGQRMADGSLTSPEFLQAETVRVGAELALEGILSELTVLVRDELGDAFLDQEGRSVVRAQWRDLASGSPINATFTPR